MNGNPLVSVIIPTNNRNQKLLECIKTVLNNTYKNIEIIIINDAPENAVYNHIKDYPVKFIQNKKRMFAAYCRNKGAKIARGKLLFFVDDDNILDKSCIKIMVEKYTNNMGLLGPIMYKKDGTLWFYGGKINWISPYAKPYLKEIKKNQLIETDVIPNAYMTTKRKYIDAGMENYKLFPNFHDDLDIAQKLKRNNYTNYILTSAKTTHDYGKLVEHIYPDRLYQMVKCSIIAERLYAPKSRRLLFFLLFLPTHIVFYLSFYIPFKAENKLNLYKSYLKGLIDGLNFNKLSGKSTPIYRQN